jgi:hypothetical protein
VVVHPGLPNIPAISNISSPSRLLATETDSAEGVDSHETRSIMRGSLRRNVVVKRAEGLQWQEIFDSVHRYFEWASGG